MEAADVQDDCRLSILASVKTTRQLRAAKAHWHENTSLCSNGFGMAQCALVDAMEKSLTWRQCCSICRQILRQCLHYELQKANIADQALDRVV